MHPHVLPVLWSLPYSPWSDQARWALEHCGVTYERRTYQPLIGEPALRLKLRRWSGPVSVPVLETPDQVLGDSYEIAQWADRHAAREELRLFPEGREAEIRAFNERAQRALAAGRILGLRRVLADQDALLGLVPGRIRRALGRRVAVTISTVGVRRTIRKYADVTPTDLERTLVEHIDSLSEELRTTPPAADGVPYLLGELSYADIVMAESLAFIVPPRTHLRLTDATRRAYTHAALAERAAEVLAWRDTLYARRPPDRHARPDRSAGNGPVP